MGTAVPLGLISGVATMVYGCRALELPIGRYLWEGMISPGPDEPRLRGSGGDRTGGVPAGRLGAAGRHGRGCWLLFAACAWRFGLAAHERERWGRMVSGLLGSRNPDRTPEVAA